MFYSSRSQAVKVFSGSSLSSNRNILFRNTLYFFLGLISLFFSPQASPAYVTNMTRGVTEISREIYHLHMLIFWVSVGIGIVVFGVLFYSLFYHRKSRGAVAAHFHEHPLVEIVWTIIPCLILIGMAFPATRLLLKMANTEDSVISVKITGHQWRWEYEYLGRGIRFISNNATPELQTLNLAPKEENYLLTVDKPLVLPIGKKIRFLTTSSDVIHSWWMPAIGIKKDAIPGFINEAWAIIEKPGTYRGQCAELCGVHHGFMPIVIEAKTEEEFNAWVEKQTAPPAPPAAAPAQPAPVQSAPSQGTTPAQQQPVQPQPAQQQPAEQQPIQQQPAQKQPTQQQAPTQPAATQVTPSQQQGATTQQQGATTQQQGATTQQATPTPQQSTPVQQQGSPIQQQSAPAQPNTPEKTQVNPKATKIIGKPNE